MTAFGDGDPVGRFDPRQNKMPVPVTGIFDNPRNCVAINVDWRGYLIGVIERLAWGDIWDGSEAEQDRAVQEIYKLVNELATGECEVPTIFRQDPTRPCVMQYSTDDGANWSDAFDYSQCTAIATSETAVNISLDWNAAETENANTMGTYNGDITNVAPDFGYDSSPDDAYRDAALCWAIRSVVDTVCEAAISIIEDQNADAAEYAGVWRSVSGVGGFISGALAASGVFAPAATISGLLFGLSNVLVDIALTIIAQDPGDYQDEQAREDVACLMYGVMRGQTPTFAHWTLSANGSLSGAAETIRQTMVEAVKSEEAFVQLMVAFNDVVALEGDIPGCPCPPPDNPFLITFDTLTDSEWVVTEDADANFNVTQAGSNQSNQQGDPIPSAKANFGTAISSGLPGINKRLRITFPVARTLQSIHFHYWFLQPINNVVARNIELYDAFGGLIDAVGDSGNNAPQQDWSSTFGWSGNAALVKSVVLRASVVANGFNSGNTQFYFDNVEGL